MIKYHPNKRDVIISTEKHHQNLQNRIAYFEMPGDDGYKILVIKTIFTHTTKYEGQIWYNYSILGSHTKSDFNYDFTN